MMKDANRYTLMIIIV